MKTIHKYLSIALSLLLIASALPLPAGVYAAEPPEIAFGTCGENVEWRLVENDEGYWAYDDEKHTPVENPAENGTEGTHFEQRFTLYVEGTGAIDDFYYDEDETKNVPQPWEEYRWGISRVEVAEDVTRVGDSAFRWFDNLRTVLLPESLREIGAFAFEHCVSGYDEGTGWKANGGLTTISIPAGVTYIAGQAFANNDYLETVNFAGDLAAICLAGDEEYADRSGFDRVREVFDRTPWFSAWVEENYMQGDCGENATWQLIKEGGYWAYDDPQNTPVENPADYNTNGTHWEERYTLKINGAGAMDDYNYDEYDGELNPQPWEALSWNIAKVEVADGITRIGDSAFRWCNNLRTVILPDSLKEIGAFAFEGCVFGWGDENGSYITDSLREITIPDGVTYLGRKAFSDNDFFETVNFAGDLAAVCLAGEEETADWSEFERVREVFDRTPWFSAWMEENYMNGDCGENATWKLLEEGSYWAYDDPQNTPVEDPSDYDTNGTHWEVRYTLQINGTGPMEDYVYSEENNFPQPWDGLSWQIAKVVVAEGITRIGNSAFRWFDNLRTVILPDSLREIGAFAFEHCVSGYDEGTGWKANGGLTTISIPAGVTYIAGQAFANNDYLETVNFAGDLTAVCLAGEEETADWSEFERVREVFDRTPWFSAWMEENYMNGDCGENATWKLVEEGSYWAYDDPQNTPVEDPSDYDTNGTHWEVRYTLQINGTGPMEDYVYSEENNFPQPWDGLSWQIAKVVVAEGITRIGDSAFRWFDHLKTVILPESLREIGAFAFEHCVAGWGDENGFYTSDGLSEITIPDGVTYLGNMAFGNNEFLETVNFAGDVTALCLTGDDYAADWPEMERVFAVFGNTPWLEAYIQENYLHGTCGENVTWRLVENEDGLWVYNENGEAVPDPAAENEEDIHFERRLTLVIEGAGAMEDYVFAFDPENDKLPPWDYFSPMVTRIEVCDGVTAIGDNAFRWFDNLKEVSLPDTLLSIGAWAFESCKHGVGEGDDWTPVYGLEEISIPASVTYIGEQAFANNDFLVTVNAACDLGAVCHAGEDFWEGIHPVGRITNVFHGCPWLDQWIEENYMSGTCGENVSWRLEDTGEGIWVYAETGLPVEDPADYGAEGTFYANFYRLVITGTGPMDDFENGIPALDYYGINVKYLVIESGVTAVGDNAFVNCPELLSVSLPLSLESVGQNAFGASEHLENVYYEAPGDAADWAAIGFEDGNDPLLNALLQLHTHTPGQMAIENEVAATCETAGSYDAVVYCTECGKELSRNTSTTDPLGHDYGAVVYEWAADCTVCVAKKVCKRNASHVWQEKSNKPVEKRTEPTCTEAGSIVYTASFNNKSLKTQTKTVILPAKGHTPGKPVKENEVAATEETPAAWDEVVYCTVCKAELSRTHKTGEKLPVSVQPGDVNGDGTVNTGDARMALRISIGLEPEITPGTKAYKAADVDGSGKVTTADARYILRRAIGLPDPDIW